MAALAAYSQKVNKYATAGVEAPGVIHSIRPAGTPDISGATMNEFEVTIRPRRRPVRDHHRAEHVPFQMEGISEGMAIVVSTTPTTRPRQSCTAGSASHRSPAPSRKLDMGLSGREGRDKGREGARRLPRRDAVDEGRVQDIKAVSDDRGQNAILQNGAPAKAIVRLRKPSPTEKSAMQIELEIHPSDGDAYPVRTCIRGPTEDAAVGGHGSTGKISAVDLPGRGEWTRSRARSQRRAAT